MLRNIMLTIFRTTRRTITKFLPHSWETGTWLGKFFQIFPVRFLFVLDVARLRREASMFFGGSLGQCLSQTAE